jgi:multidrug efflux system membrane fusion protein
METKSKNTASHSIPRWAYIVFAVLAVLLLWRTYLQKKNAVAAAQPPARPVSVAKVTTKDVPLYLDEIGTCAAYATVQVQAQVTGQITSRNFQDGADVKKGDLLFSIDPRPYQAALDQAQGLLGQAKSQLVLDQITLKRQQDLRSKGVVSPQDLDLAQGTVNNDEAKVKSADAAVAAAQVNLDYCSIRSPIDGRAGLRNVDVGNLVAPNGPALLTIQALDPIYTDFTVAEPDLPLVRRYLGGPNVKVETKSEDENVPSRTGDLYFIDNAVQPGAGTVKARASTPNSDRAFWPAQFVRVRLILDILKEAKLVPNGAVQIGQNGPYVFVVKEDSTLDLRPVKPGQRQGDLVVVNDGLKPGETVVVAGQLQLAPGTKVVAQPSESPNEGTSAASNAGLN